MPISAGFMGRRADSIRPIRSGVKRCSVVRFFGPAARQCGSAVECDRFGACGRSAGRCRRSTRSNVAIGVGDFADGAAPERGPARAHRRRRSGARRRPAGAHRRRLSMLANGRRAARRCTQQSTPCPTRRCAQRWKSRLRLPMRRTRASIRLLLEVAQKAWKRTSAAPATFNMEMHGAAAKAAVVLGKPDVARSEAQIGVDAWHSQSGVRARRYEVALDLLLSQVEASSGHPGCGAATRRRGRAHRRGHLRREQPGARSRRRSARCGARDDRSLRRGARTARSDR